MRPVRRHPRLGHRLAQVLPLPHRRADRRRCNTSNPSAEASSQTAGGSGTTAAESPTSTSASEAIAWPSVLPDTGGVRPSWRSARDITTCEPATGTLPVRAPPGPSFEAMPDRSTPFARVPSVVGAAESSVATGPATAAEATSTALIARSPAAIPFLSFMSRISKYLMSFAARPPATASLPTAAQ